MPLPKRKRIFTPKRKTKHMKEVIEAREKSTGSDNDVIMARGRLKGALMDVLETAEESDTSVEYTPVKKERKGSIEDNEFTSDEEEKEKQHKSPPRQSYVLKLFDRSVDLSQFNEDSPLYPICRAWIANKPKANYKDFGQESETEETEEGIDLPGPNGPPVSKIPKLLPEQQTHHLDKINLNYRDCPLPSREHLLRSHLSRWTEVRNTWLVRAADVEARYASSQIILNGINVSGS